nr:hypothetical protein [Thermococcus sp.]
MLYEVLKEGLFWAGLGRPSEVMPFLRGKLLERNVDGRRRECIEHLLNELEHFYQRVSWSGSIGESEWKAIKSFHRDLIALLY